MPHYVQSIILGVWCTVWWNFETHWQRQEWDSTENRFFQQKGHSEELPCLARKRRENQKEFRMPVIPVPEWMIDIYVSFLCIYASWRLWRSFTDLYERLFSLRYLGPTDTPSTSPTCDLPYSSNLRILRSSCQYINASMADILEKMPGVSGK